jgi:hypothetical protein|tara:strand:+ start:19604 stop:20251 length:648 start_codon:yes stop_codon:yes gene_type:complete
MAISVTEILGTDSLSGSRLVINDNFNVLASEINSMEVYFAPSAGTITNLNNVSTEALRVGLSTVLLDINASTFDILTNVKMTGNLNLTGGGLFRNDTNPTTQNDTLAGPGMTLDIGATGAIPPYSIYRVGNSDTTNNLQIDIFNGSIGQELFLIYAESNTGTVRFNGVSNNLVLTGAGSNLDLTALGQSVHLLCIDNGSGVGVWYVVGGTGYTVS